MKSLKPKFCASCKNKFNPARPFQNVCSPVCAYNHSKAIKQKKEASVWQKEKKALKEKLKTLSQYESDAKKSFQRYIRLRDRDLPCISCNTSSSELKDGGHFKKAEIYSGVIFNEDNCHSQCRKCNRYLNGNELMYREGLVKRYGEEFTKNIENFANETRQYKWSKEQLIAKKLQYDIKYKELLNQLK